MDHPEAQLEEERERWVEDHLEERHQQHMGEWWLRKDDFEEEAGLAVAELNLRKHDECEAQKKEMRTALARGKDEIEQSSQEWLAQPLDSKGKPIELARTETPVEFLPEGAELVVDLDLGCDESHFLSEKDLFSKAIEVAAGLFRLNPKVDLITLSSYMERRDQAGRPYDEYILSIRFPREAFVEARSWANDIDDPDEFRERYALFLKQFDPVKFCKQFDLRFEREGLIGPIKAIEPFHSYPHREREEPLPPSDGLFPRYRDHFFSITGDRESYKFSYPSWGVSFEPGLHECVDAHKAKVGASWKQLYGRSSGKHVLEDLLDRCPSFGLHWMAAEVKPLDYWERELAEMQPRHREPEAFKEPKPSDGDRLDQATDAWLERKRRFEEEAELAAAEENVRLYDEYKAQKAELRKKLENDKETTEDFLEAMLGKCHLPWRIVASLEYRPETSTLMLDLQLPEEPAASNSRRIGNPVVARWEGLDVVSRKGDFDRKEVGKRSEEEYSAGSWGGYPFGLAIYLASHIFAECPRIERIVLSYQAMRWEVMDEDWFAEKVDGLGFCERELVFRDYLLSIRFTREGFIGVDFSDFDAKDFCMRFENRCRLGKDWLSRPTLSQRWRPDADYGDFYAIVPFED